MSENEYVRFQRSDHVLCNGQTNENLPILVSRKIKKRYILVNTDYSLIVLDIKCYLNNYGRLHELGLQIGFNNFSHIIIEIMCNKYYIVYVLITILSQFGTYKIRFFHGD